MNEFGDRIKLVHNLRECYESIGRLLDQPIPAFLARVGGSDADLVIEYFYYSRTIGPAQSLERILPKFGLAKLFNGYYDRSEKLANVVRYLELMTHCYVQSADLLVVGAPLLTEFFPNSLNPVFHMDTAAFRESFHTFFGAIGSGMQRQATFYPYTFVEHILQNEWTLFKLFAEKLPGKRVVAVTPFSESIHQNFCRRHGFFKNYDYPEFDLVTYNTPITYHGLPSEFYPDHDWFETVERMQCEIGTLDFDIALLSCGSYAMPLGRFIQANLRRKAIYVGGCLQLFFGVTGRRYNDPFFEDQLHLENFILPVERDRYLPHVNIHHQTAKDAFGAYF